MACLNRRDAVALALQRVTLASSHRNVLEQRYRALCAEQDDLEARLTAAAAALPE